MIERDRTSGNESTSKKRKRLDEEGESSARHAPGTGHHMSAFESEGNGDPNRDKVPEDEVATIAANIAAAIAQAQAQAGWDPESEDGEGSQEEEDADNTDGEGPSVVAGVKYGDGKDDLDEWVNRDSKAVEDGEEDDTRHHSRRPGESEGSGG
jgi:hypothetical protein